MRTVFLEKIIMIRAGSNIDLVISLEKEPYHENDANFEGNNRKVLAKFQNPFH